MYARNGVAYENLRAEMGRRQLTIGEMASAIGMNRDTLSRKLSRSVPMNLDEAYRLVSTCFPDCRLEDLFAESFR